MDFYSSEQKILKNYLEHYGVKGMKWGVLRSLQNRNVGRGMIKIGSNTTNGNQNNSVGSGVNALSTAVKKQTYVKNVLSKNANNKQPSEFAKRLISNETNIGDGSSNLYSTGMMPYNNVGNNSLVALSSGTNAISEEEDDDKKEDMIDKIKKSIKSLFSFKIIDIDKDKINDAKKAVESFFSKLKR